METKKNEKYDLENKRPMFFGIGMMISLSLAITAFEWKTEVEPIVIPQELEEDIWYAVDEITITKHEILELPKPIKPEVKKITLERIVEAIDEKPITKDSEFKLDNIEDFIDESSFTAPVVEEAPFEIVEEMPSFPGGELELIKFLGSQTKYPRLARNMGVQGRVYLQFIVEKDGSLSEVEVIKGIGAGCDQEALRVMNLVPNFNPGKQRGKPVRVKMILPINFTLQ